MKNDYINPFILRNGILQNSTVDWIDETVGWDVAGTLTFNGVVQNWGVDYRNKMAERSIKHYWNLVDSWCYGNASRKYNKRVPRFCFVHHSDRNIHYHFIAKSPNHKVDKSAFRRSLKYIWSEKIDGAGDYNSVKEVYDARGWANYISDELRWRSTDSLALVVTHLNT